MHTHTHSLSQTQLAVPARMGNRNMREHMQAPAHTHRACTHIGRRRPAGTRTRATPTHPHTHTHTYSRYLERGHELVTHAVLRVQHVRCVQLHRRGKQNELGIEIGSRVGAPSHTQTHTHTTHSLTHTRMRARTQMHACSHKCGSTLSRVEVGIHNPVRGG